MAEYGQVNMLYDRAIYNGMVLTINPWFDIIQDGVVGIRNGVFDRVERRVQEISEYPAAEYIDASGRIIRTTGGRL